MFDFFFRYFLLFPKILIHEHWGILIGEIVLILYWPYFLATRNKLKVNDILVSYYLFVIYFVFISSLIGALGFGFFPMHATLYLVRMILSLGIFVWAYSYYPKIADNIEIVKRVYNKPFVIHFFLGAIIVAVYYVTFKPTTNEMLWDYKVGLRMIPFAGMVIDTESFFFLKVVSGSGNLLSGWALGILILNFNLGKGNFSRGMIIIAVLTVLAAVSRGGFLTMTLYLVYRYIKGFDGKISMRSFILAVSFIAGLVFYISLAATTALPNVFERLVNTYDGSGSGFDGSTVGRFDNYIALLKVWVTKLQYILFGFGFDEDALLKATNQTVVESFFLEIFVCAGLIGTFLFILFMATSFVNHQKNYWYRCLWEFLIFQSIISWTVTGGDFLAPHATYLMMTFIGFGFAQQSISTNAPARAST